MGVHVLGRQGHVCPAIDFLRIWFSVVGGQIVVSHGPRDPPRTHGAIGAGQKPPLSCQARVCGEGLTLR